MEIKTVFLKKLTTEKTDMKVTSIIAYIFGFVLFGIGLFILTKLNMSIEMIFLVFLSLFILFFQMMIIAAVFELYGKLQCLDDKIQ